MNSGPNSSEQPRVSTQLVKPHSGPSQRPMARKYNISELSLRIRAVYWDVILGNGIQVLTVPRGEDAFGEVTAARDIARRGKGSHGDRREKGYDNSGLHF